MANICIIPARGGSKRIPRKNIRPFAGRPIISYSIKAALNSGIFEEVMVSTDDHEIAEIAKSFGASIPSLRSAKNSNDYATLGDVVEEVLTDYNKNNRSFEMVGCLLPTAPFVDESKIIEAHQKLIKEELDSVFFVQKFNYPIWRSLKLNDQGRLEMNWPEYLNTRSQDLPESFHDAGLFYLAKTDQLILQKTFFTKNAGGILIDDLDARDIDTEEDWVFAEKIFLMNKK